MQVLQLLAFLTFDPFIPVQEVNEESKELMKQALEEVSITLIYPSKTLNSTWYKNQVHNPLKEFMWFIREHAKILYAELFFALCNLALLHPQTILSREKFIQTSYVSV